MVDPVKGVELVTKFAQVPEGNPDALAAGEKLAKAASTIATTLNIALLPLTVLNTMVGKAQTYFNGPFSKDLENKTKEIPPENIVEPKAAIAGAVVQGLAYSHDDVDLKELYLHLMASSMNSEVASTVHPSFPDIIGKLNGDEARHLKAILSAAWSFDIASIGVHRHGQRFVLVLSNLLNIQENGKPLSHPDLSIWVDNWIRLGLFALDWESNGSFLNTLWVKTRQEFRDLQATMKLENETLEVRGGVLLRTDLCNRFARSVGIPDPGKLPVDV